MGLAVQFFKVTALPSVCQPNSFYYVESSGSITPYLTDQVGNPQAFGGGGGTRIYGEVLTGVINNSNNTFTTVNSFIPGTEEVFINGMKQTVSVDYVTSNDDTIIFTDAPTTSANGTDVLEINYNKS